MKLAVLRCDALLLSSCNVVGSALGGAGQRCEPMKPLLPVKEYLVILTR